MEGKVHLKMLLLAVVLVGLIIKSNSVRIEREVWVERRLKELNRPAKKTIQMRPSTNSLNMSSSSSTVSQLWQKSRSCPKGTIPVRRVTKHDLLRAPYLQHYGMKEPETFRAGDNSMGLLPNHSVTIAMALGSSYHGGQADLTVWNPYVEPDDYSTASMALKSSLYDNFEAIEVGWMVPDDADFTIAKGKKSPLRSFGEDEDDWGFFVP
ncbi:hypothetical protein QJS10_CPA06g00940 [Acorus calamus]|uniref:Neprosin activation peptide domain-containing protein n=1 Tax=Acorus calamus TaxID=4465 RepID=A0AAV9EHM3_ACOCL|nr:hypothetical protein QJS10_CPA06g00940 [Acorus calamus]